MKVRTLFAICLTALAGAAVWALPAQAAETFYWSNYGSNSLAFANLDGSGGGGFDSAGQEVVGSEGLAIDSASGRLYWANFTNGSDTGAIRYAGLGGGDGGQLNTGGANVDEPAGVAIDPTTRTIYWTNYGGGDEDNGTISWARLDGSGAGDLNAAGATVLSPEAIAVDPSGGKVYWSNEDDTISYANLDNSGGGGKFNVSGASAPDGVTGIAVDSDRGRIYWLNNGSSESVSYANLGGGGGGDFDYGSASLNGPYGLTLDPTSGKLYWGNYGNDEEKTGVFGFLSVGGGPNGGINIASAPVDGPQNPVILKGPSGTGAPTVTRTAKTTALSCSQGTWAEDAGGAFYYQAPKDYVYQWNLNGVPIVGANAPTYAAQGPGAYSCTVTGLNHNGSASQTSGALALRAGKLSLGLRKHKAQVKAGKKPGVYRLVVNNSGDFSIAAAQLCVKVPKKARKALKKPKCRRIANLVAHKKRTVKVRLKAKKNARGTYKVRFLLRGKGGAKPVKAKLAVKPQKKKRKG